jgi:hypothetical protein
LSRVVTEGEEVTIDQVPKEEHPSVEVEFDICGSSEDHNFSANQGKPRSIQPILIIYKCFYKLSPMIYALGYRGSIEIIAA